MLQKGGRAWAFVKLVPAEGLEPPLAEANEILSLVCLPVPPSGHRAESSMGRRGRGLGYSAAASI